jgi:hypothetical protein
MKKNTIPIDKEEKELETASAKDISDDLGEISEEEYNYYINLPNKP